MLYAGEDVKFIARRIMICASEDVGNADPNALVVAVSAAQAVERIGMPESQIILSQAAAYVATAPKSNAAYMGIAKAMKTVADTRTMPVPAHLQDRHYKGAEKLGHGLTTTRTTMSPSSTCRTEWRECGSMSRRRTGMRRRSGSIWSLSREKPGRQNKEFCEIIR